MLFGMVGVVFVGVSVPDLGVCFGSTFFAASSGAGAVAMCTEVPDHGAGSQGRHVKSAVPNIAGVSVPLLGRHALSVLQ